MNRIENPVGFADRLSQGNVARQELIDLARAHSIRPADVSSARGVEPLAESYP